MIKLKKGIRKTSLKEHEAHLCDRFVEYNGCTNLYGCDRPATYFVDGSYRCGPHVPKRFKASTE